MGLFTLHNCCILWLLNYLKLKLDSQSRLTISEFSGYHCSIDTCRPHNNFFEAFKKFFQEMLLLDNFFKLIQFHEVCSSQINIIIKVLKSYF